MTRRLSRVAIVLVLFVIPSAPTWADDPLLSGPDAPPFAPSAGLQYPARQDVASFQPQAGPVWTAGSPQPGFVQPPQSQWSRGPVGAQPEPMSRSAQADVQVSGNGIVHLPPTGPSALGTSPPSLPGSKPSVDGTYREDGQYVTITIDGKEMRLFKPPATQLPLAPSAPGMAEGTVRGRLMQGGRPLVNCRVVMVPLEGEGKTYRYASNLQPLSTATDNEGIYNFERVPVGKYKLTWLPDGTNQWIRRIAVKPDVVVHAGQAVNVNSIGAATRTIN